jgi:transposase
MIDVSRIGLDLAKSVFQVHGVNAHEQVTVRRSLRRTQMLDWFSKLPPCLIGIEACGTAHHWARELSALGHTVRLMPPGYVKAYVRRNKNDAADAAAICEAVSRPSMRFVEPKSAGQQAAASLHRVREMLTKQQTAAMNSLRGQLAEFGIVAAKGARGFGELLAIVADTEDGRIPDLLRMTLACITATLDSLKRQLEKVDKAMAEWGRSDTNSRHLSTIPGVGVVTATAVSARVTNPRGFDSGRHFAASLGIVPRQDGTGGKVKLGPISKRGDGYLRRLLVNGALAVLRSKQARQDPWLAKLLDSKPLMLAAVALANKNARIIWALMIRQEDFRPRVPAAA